MRGDVELSTWRTDSVACSCCVYRQAKLVYTFYIYSVILIFPSGGVCMFFNTVWFINSVNILYIKGCGVTVLSVSFVITFYSMYETMML